MAVLAAAALVPNASAANPRLTKERATAIFIGSDKVADWLDRYPRKGRVTDATYEADASKCSGAQGGCWTVHVWWSNKDKSVDAGEIAQGKVDDASTRVTEAWTGPQVAWKMARGYEGAFGGKKINSWPVWLAFCVVFLLGLADFRRPLSLRNLDLLALLSFSVSLWYFNDGNIFTSVPLAYPPLVYLLARCIWIGARARPVRAARPLWKPAVLLAAAVFLIGFRVGLNLEDSNVIDVGYAGVIGAQRISSGVMPYDNFPKEDELKACGPADSEGEIRDRIQFNGRCESANPLGDTYGPVAYEAYLPGYWIRGWSGKWDKLPAVHLTSIIFDVLCALGLGARRLTLRRSLARCSARVRVGSVPVHPVRLHVEHERRDRAGLSHLRLLAGHLAVGARDLGRALRLDEVRDPHRRAALADLSRPGAATSSGACLRRGIPGRHTRCLFHPAARRTSDPGGADVLRAHAEDADQS